MTHGREGEGLIPFEERAPVSAENEDDLSRRSVLQQAAVGGGGFGPVATHRCLRARHSMPANRAALGPLRPPGPGKSGGLKTGHPAEKSCF